MQGLNTCTACKISREGISPVPPRGNPNARYMIIGEAPGREEDRVGSPFVGNSGIYLEDLLELGGIKPEDCYWTNVAKCWPGVSVNGSQKKPMKSGLTTCMELWLSKEISSCQPEFIITLGAVALKALYPQHKIADVHGQILDGELSGYDPVKQAKIPVIAMYHPAAVLHQVEMKIKVEDDFRLLQVKLKEHGTEAYVPPYEFIETEEKREGVMAEIAALPGTTPVAFDFETTDLRTHLANCIGVAIAWKDRAVYVPIAGSKELPSFTSLWSHVFLLCHNSKYEMGILRAAGINLSPPEDTLILAALLEEESKGLKRLAMREFGYQMQTYEEVVGEGASAVPMDQIPPEDVGPYAAADAHFTLRLWDVLSERMDSTLWGVYHNIEKPLLPAIVEMEQEGCRLDSGSITLAVDRLTDLYESKLKALRRAFGNPEYNPISPPQTLEHLNEAIRKHTASSGTTVKALKNTKANTLQELSEFLPLARDVIQARHLKKLATTYAAGLEKMIPRAYGSINPTGTKTGRFSYSGWKQQGEQWGINLQTIPKPKMWEDAADAESNWIRSCFVADHGMVFIEADYSQVELRYAAHLSRCASMIATYRDGGDIHDDMVEEARLGDYLPSADPDSIRRVAKVLNFGTQYDPYNDSAIGVIMRTCAEAEVRLTRVEARNLLLAKRATQPEMIRFYQEIKSQIINRGYVETEMGRRLHPVWLEGSGFDVMYKNMETHRIGVNMPIQGGCADIMKMAIIDLHRTRQDYVRFVWTVHDSLLVQCPEDKVEETSRWMKQIMEGVLKLRVPLEVDTKVGKNLAEMH